VANETFLGWNPILQTKEGLVSFCTSIRSLPQQFRLVRASLLESPGLPFAESLSEEAIETAFQEEGVSFGQDDGDVYTPALTLWAFLSQMLFKDEQRSCVAAVSRVVVLLVSLGRKPCSDNTGAYCRARAKLSERVLCRLTYQVADGCEAVLPRAWRWKGLTVSLVDGFTLSMPDTPENQEAYPQSSSQEEGLRFPVLRGLVALSLATAMVRGLAVGPCLGKETGETALLRELFDRFRPGDVIVADRYHCSYFMICLLKERGVNVVVRLHQRRKADFRRGKPLGPGDHLVEWLRPPRPDWMDEETYQRMPKSLQVREVEVAVAQPGFRVRKLVVVTTLLDAREYTRKDLAELYHQRWLAELDIRAIKCSMGIDVLRCKSPAMVRKEIWACLLAYNLIRRRLLQSALARKRSPRQISFTAAMQKIAASWRQGPLLDGETAAALLEIDWKHLAAHRVGHRPNRVEPRAIKRRPKPHDLLMMPRAEARAALLRSNP
jgi:putative transposase